MSTRGGQAAVPSGPARLPSWPGSCCCPGSCGWRCGRPGAPPLCGSGSRTQTGAVPRTGPPRAPRAITAGPGTPRPKGYCLSSASTSGPASGSAAAASSGSSTKRFSSYWSMSRRRKREESVLRAMARPARRKRPRRPEPEPEPAPAPPRPGSHTPRAGKTQQSRGKIRTMTLMYKSRRCSRFAGRIGIPRKTEQTGDGEQPLDRFTGIQERSEKAGSVCTGSPGPAARRALTLLLKFLKTYQKQKAERETGPSGSRCVVV